MGFLSRLGKALNRLSHPRTKFILMTVTQLHNSIIFNSTVKDCHKQEEIENF